ncbi:MAG: hypothetical protein KGI11_10265 [Thaumarchaeota archaeon]|nr:hypothetical protein [Nitrososphaerota archaeon]
MSWAYNYDELGHDTFIVFVELKLEGKWSRGGIQDEFAPDEDDDVLSAENSEHCFVHLIEPDGLRRIFQFMKGATINVRQNVLSYYSEQIIEEHSVDEKAQEGKRNTRDML